MGTTPEMDWDECPLTESVQRIGEAPNPGPRALLQLLGDWSAVAFRKATQPCIYSVVTTNVGGWGTGREQVGARMV
eukprot:6111568-Amphidinium_carterae.1